MGMNAGPMGGAGYGRDGMNSSGVILLVILAVGMLVMAPLLIGVMLTGTTDLCGEIEQNPVIASCDCRAEKERAAQAEAAGNQAAERATALEAQLAEANRRIQELEAVRQNEAVASQALVDQLVAAQSELSAAQAELAATRTELAGAQERLRQLETQLAELQAQHEQDAQAHLFDQTVNALAVEQIEACRVEVLSLQEQLEAALSRYFWQTWDWDANSPLVWLFALTLVGAPSGALVGGLVARRAGRRPH